MDLNTKVTDWIAVYAAALSTWVFFWQVRQGKPRIKVAVVPGIVDGDFGAFISIQNRSAHAVNLTTCSLVYPWRKLTKVNWLKAAWQTRTVPKRLGWIHGFLPEGVDSGLPTQVAPHNAHTIFVPEATLFDLLGTSAKKVVFKVQDALWKDHFSDEFHFGFPEFEVLEEDQSETSDA